MNLDYFITAKRLKKGEKNTLAQFIVKQAIKVVDKKGKFLDIDNMKTKPKGASHGSLEIMLTTPFVKLEDANYIVDIWCKGKGKVFSARWETPKDLEDPNEIDIINLKRGEWLEALNHL